MNRLQVWTTALLMVAAGIPTALAASGDAHHEQDASIHIPARLADASRLATETAGPGTLNRTRTVTGRVRANPEKVYRPAARYPGVVREVLVSVGERVREGQRLARVEARESLRVLDITAPAAGVVTERFLNAGEMTGDQPILEIADFDTLWLDLNLFRSDLDAVRAGQTVRWQGQPVGEIDYLYPQTDAASQVSRARVVMGSPPAAVRPGMRLTVTVVVETRDVAVRIPSGALQTLEGRTVVFTRDGDEYRPREVETGARDDVHVEILDGLEPGTDYVTENSFLLKADVLKDGASHDH